MIHPRVTLIQTEHPAQRKWQIKSEFWPTLSKFCKYTANEAKTTYT